MIIATIDVPNRYFKTQFNEWLLLSCNGCDKIFLKKRLIKDALKRQMHFHNKECACKNKKLKECRGKSRRVIASNAIPDSEKSLPNCSLVAKEFSQGERRDQNLSNEQKS